MIALRTIWLLFIIAIVHNRVGAQQFIYQPITIQHGLPSNFVTSMYFDNNGIFWIGTDKGLCWFNGSSTKVLTTDEGLSGNLIHLIFQDAGGRIWASCHEGGLAQIAIKDGKPIVNDIIKEGISIRKMFQDKNGIYWMVGWDIAFPDYKLWMTTDIKGVWSEVASFKRENDLDVDFTGTIRYAAGADLKWSEPMPSNIKTLRLPNWVKQVVTSNGRVLLAGVKQFEIEEYTEGGYKLYYRGNFFGEAVGTIKYLAKGNKDVIYKTGDFDLIFENKVLLVDKQSTKDIKLSGLFHVACDAYGNLFYSVFGEGIVAGNKGYIRKFDLQATPMRIKASGTNVIVTTSGNVFVFDSAFSIIRKREFSMNGQINFPVIKSTEEIALATNNILYFNKGKNLEGWTGVFSDYSDGLYFDDFLFLTSYSNGLTRVKDKQIDTAWQKSLKLPGYCLERLKQFDGKIFATTLSKGLLEVDPETGEVIHYDKSKGLVSNSIYDVYKVADTLFIGSRLGLTYVANGEVVKVDTSKGFVGERVVCIFKDKKNILWVLSDKYLHILKNDRLYAIRSHPVLRDADQIIRLALFNELTNQLWIGTDKDLFALDIGLIIPDNTSYPVDLASVYVGQRLLNMKDRNVSFSYNHLPIRISISNPFYSLYHKPEVFYRLAGFEEDFRLLDDGNTAVYQKLPPGNYKFEVKSIGPDFGMIPLVNLFEFEVLNPWWKRGLFLWSTIMAISLLVFFVSRYYLKLRYEQRLKIMEAEQALHIERLRIGRELHDNIGSMLTLMINKVDDMPAESAIKNAGITTIARQTLAQLRDAIWALNKDNLSTQQWISHATEYINTISGRGITAKSTFKWNPDVTLSPLEALHSFRILQEAISNALKHSGATQIEIEGRMVGEQLQLQVKDNGRGFDMETVKKGYGLRNMQKRAQEMEGTLVFNSLVGEGTSLSLTWKIL